MGFIPNGDNKTNKITSSSSSTGVTYLRNLYEVSIVNESLADGELLSFQDGNGLISLKHQQHIPLVYFKV